MSNHQWHLFDFLRNYEVRRIGNKFEVRKADAPTGAVELTPEEFEQLRQAGPSPKGLE